MCEHGPLRQYVGDLWDSRNVFTQSSTTILTLTITEELAKKIARIEDRVRQMETKMITRDDLDSLIESLELITENPAILKEIDEALREYQQGMYYTYEQVFGEKPRRTP